MILSLVQSMLNVKCSKAILVPEVEAYLVSIEDLCHASINNEIFLSLDLFSVEMDLFQHTPWLIITSFTYQLALDSVSSQGPSHSHLKARGITEKQNNIDHLFDSGCRHDVLYILLHANTHEAAIQDTSWIANAGI